MQWRMKFRIRIFQIIEFHSVFCLYKSYQYNNEHTFRISYIHSCITKLIERIVNNHRLLYLADIRWLSILYERFLRYILEEVCENFAQHTFHAYKIFFTYIGYLVFSLPCHRKKIQPEKCSIFESIHCQ